MPIPTAGGPTGKEGKVWYIIGESITDDWRSSSDQIRAGVFCISLSEGEGGLVLRLRGCRGVGWVVSVKRR